MDDTFDTPAPSGQHSSDPISEIFHSLLQLSLWFIHSFIHSIQSHYNSLDAYLKESGAAERPAVLALIALAAGAYVAHALSRLWLSIDHIQRRGGLVQGFFRWAKSIPGISHLVAAEMDRQRRKVKHKMRAAAAGGPPPVTALPPQGLPEAEVHRLLDAKQSKDSAVDDGASGVSGTVYLKRGHQDFLTGVYSRFAHTNPLHGDVFPSVQRMEPEVVAMAAGILGGGAGGACPTVCGAMTSGGTESILTAVKASRDYMMDKKGIRDPEMIIGNSAHPAFIKAAEYFRIRLKVVPVAPSGRLRAADVARAITRDTVLLVASSPSYPHGIMDDVSDIAALAARRGVLCHSDCCLGGFVLPFAKKLGYPIPPFDFSLPGVTSISADTHKFGMSHKGTSVVLYRNAEIRRYQYTAVTDWTGGLYISPGFAGSRSGALIATAWASLVRTGEGGFLEATASLMEAAGRFIKGIEAIPELEVVGRPEMCVVAFKAAPGAKINIYHVHDALIKKHWHLNALQFPPALHFCFTVRSAGCVDALLSDIRAAVSDLSDAAWRGAKVSDKGGMAPVYGLASALPDRGAVGDVMIAAQDAMLDL